MVFKIDMMKHPAPLEMGPESVEQMKNERYHSGVDGSLLDICSVLSARLQMIHAIRERFLKTLSDETEVDQLIQQSEKIFIHEPPHGYKNAGHIYKITRKEV